MDDFKTTIISLHPQNFHIWLAEIKNLASKADVWEFCDPEGTLAVPALPIPPSLSDYLIDEASGASTPATAASSDPPVRRPAVRYGELTPDQRDEWKMEMQTFQMLEKSRDRINHSLRLVDAAIIASARTYLPHGKIGGTVREVLKFLTSRYKLSADDITDQIYHQYQTLKTAPVKGKIETWVGEWEAIKTQIDQQGIEGNFGGEVLITKEFLKAGRCWAPMFCDHWVLQKKASNQEIKFFETTREYRIQVQETLADPKIKHHAHAATLQGASQASDQTSPENQDQKKGSGGNKRGYKYDDKQHEGKKCVCGEVHVFRKCPYINKEVRPSGWKEIKAKRDEVRLNILRNIKFFKVIQQLTNTNILEGITKEKVENFHGTNREPPQERAAPEISFANTSLINMVGTANPLNKSVIYDGGANGHLTHEKNRFVGEIQPPTSETWVGTPKGPMQVMGYGTMRVAGTLNGKPGSLLFEGTAYVPDSDVTLVSANRGHLYIYYTPNFGFRIAVLGREREQGRYRGSTEGAPREHGRAARERRVCKTFLQHRKRFGRQNSISVAAQARSLRKSYKSNSRILSKYFS